jgi:hypothetical protein
MIAKGGDIMLQGDRLRKDRSIPVFRNRDQDHANLGQKGQTTNRQKERGA